MSRPPADLSLMLVTDAAMAGTRGLMRIVLDAVDGGVTIVQLRDKTTADHVLVALARQLKAELAPRGIPLIVNDRIAVAQAAGADGVHLGQSDDAPSLARERLGPKALVGLSVTTAEQAPGVDPAVVDYVGLGPVFATGSKPDADPPLGLNAARLIRSRLPVPTVAIGGICAANAGAVMAAGMDGIAVVSAICAAADPRAAAAALRAAMAPEAAR